MEIEGKIIVKLDPMGGTSKAGNAWTKQEYVLETEDAYPKKVHFDFFGERATQYPLEVGDKVRLSFDIESREYNGRWYTSIRGWKAEKIDGQAPAQPSAPVDPFGAPYAGVPADATAPSGDANSFLDGSAATDDLPF